MFSTEVLMLVHGSTLKWFQASLKLYSPAKGLENKISPSSTHNTENSDLTAYTSKHNTENNGTIAYTSKHSENGGPTAYTSKHLHNTENSGLTAYTSKHSHNTENSGPIAYTSKHSPITAVKFPRGDMFIK